LKFILTVLYLNQSWFYSSKEKSTARQSKYNAYPTQGYKLFLRPQDDTKGMIKELKDNKWIDLQTRLVALDFTIYNGNINLFSQIRYFRYYI
jgi:hypothetical protein